MLAGSEASCDRARVSAAFAVASANAAETAHSIMAQHAPPTDDAYVLTFAPAETAPPSFEDFSQAFYLPPEPRDADDYQMLPDLDAALLGGPEPSFDWRDDGVLLFN
jgi:hypothetical protein